MSNMLTGSYVASQAVTALGSLSAIFYSYATEESFTGLKGVLAAMMTGAPTGLIAGVETAGCALVGGAVGVAVGSLAKNADGVGGVFAMAAGGLSAIVTIPHAYGIVSSITVDGMAHQEQAAALSETPEYVQAAHQLEHNYTMQALTVPANN